MENMQSSDFEKLLNSNLIGKRDGIQYIQTLHRKKLCDFWKIKEGQTILEIGCGQGDSTAVLASCVGKSGKVIALDSADEHYGQPLTLGEATKLIKDSYLGNNVEFIFNLDILNADLSFLAKYSIDALVISHASWYFNNEKILEQILNKIKPYTDTLHFAEWHTGLRTLNQFGHWLSVMIQAQYDIVHPNHSHNIHTAYSIQQVRNSIINIGGIVQNETILTDVNLQDGKWETEFVLQELKHTIITSNSICNKQKQLWQSQIEHLEEIHSLFDPKPLDVYVCSANIGNM